MIDIVIYQNWNGLLFFTFGMVELKHERIN